MTYERRARKRISGSWNVSVGLAASQKMQPDAPPLAPVTYDSRQGVKRRSMSVDSLQSSVVGRADSRQSNHQSPVAVDCRLSMRLCTDDRRLTVDSRPQTVDCQMASASGGMDASSGGAEVVGAGSRLINSLSSLPGLKYGTFFGGTSTLS